MTIMSTLSESRSKCEEAECMSPEYDGLYVDVLGPAYGGWWNWIEPPPYIRHRHLLLRPNNLRASSSHPSSTHYYKTLIRGNGLYEWNEPMAPICKQRKDDEPYCEVWEAVLRFQSIGNQESKYSVHAEISPFPRYPMPI